MIILLAIVVTAACVPLAALGMVSLGSRREDAAHSLSSGPSGMLEAAARRLVGFHGDGVARESGRRGAAGAHRRAGGYLEDYGYLHGTQLDGTALEGTEVPHLVA